MEQGKRRVVITGLGTVNPLGNNVKDFWEGIKAGRSGIGKITRFDTTEYPAQIAGEVKGFDPATIVDNRDARRMDRFTLYAMAAALEAMNDAGLVADTLDHERFGVVLGNGIGGMESLEDAYFNLFEKGPRRIPVMTIPKLISNIAPGQIAIRLQAWGPCYTVVTACSSSADAIGEAAKWIQDGLADVMITGGTEAAITKMGIGGFCVLQTLATKFNSTPEKASRPFDKGRDGFVLSEGAGLLILEDYEFAKKRGAHIYAEFGGAGMTCDANHVTAPHPEGRGAILAMKIALARAGMKPEDVDYINAHGTSTHLNDATETKAIKAAFGEHAYKVKISSTKSMTGHCVGAAGGVEAIVSILAIRDQFFPPTINLDEADPECDLDYVPNKGIHGKIDVVMSNSLGFGGHNGILVLKKFVE